MIINVKAYPASKKNQISSFLIDKNSNEYIKIHITEKAEDNKANDAIIKILAKTLNTQKSNIKIILGEKQKNKVIKIENIEEEEIKSIISKDSLF